MPIYVVIHLFSSLEPSILLLWSALLAVLTYAQLLSWDFPFSASKFPLPLLHDEAPLPHTLVKHIFQWLPFESTGNKIFENLPI